MTAAMERTENVISMRDQGGTEEVSARLLASAARLSRNAMTEIDWSKPMDPTKYGCSRSGRRSTAPTTGTS